MPTEAILPLAACRAVGGDAAAAVPVAAAVNAAVASLRLFDDLADQDRPGQLWSQVGPARAWNYAAGAQFLSFSILNRAALPAPVFHRVSQVFSRAFLQVAAGQDRDLSGQASTIEDYWLTMELRSGEAYAAACASGALVGTSATPLIDACANFGYHLGLTMQIFNDFESIWPSRGRTDRERIRMGLPLLYALRLEHPSVAELLSLVSGEQLGTRADRVREILDELGTRRFLVWTALKEREQALTALSTCPNSEGRDALASIITGLFGDVDELLASVPFSQVPVGESEA